MHKNERTSYRILIGFLCLTMVLVLMPTVAFAAGPVELDKKVSLKVEYRPEGQAASGVTFRLYKVAEMSSDVDFTWTSDFRDYSLSLEGLSSTGWRKLANTLEGYVFRDRIPALDQGRTDHRGALSFPQREKSLTPGLYLVIGDSHRDGRYTYQPESFLIALPNRNVKDQWEYDVTAVPKYDSSYDMDGKKIDRRVLKVWKDDGNQAQRPSEITVELLRDGRLFDTVRLSERNQWRYTWKDLDGSYRWHIVEKSVPQGYTVSTDQEGITFVITNSYGPDRPTDPGKPTDPGEKLPHTGMLWWPVPLLAASGVMVFLLGWLINLKAKKVKQ